MPTGAAQLKGLEVPMHHGRAFHGLAVSYATGARGACYLKGDYYNIDLGRSYVPIEQTIKEHFQQILDDGLLSKT
jgi:aldehyde:ferredoxin oxidoreductase